MSKDNLTPQQRMLNFGAWTRQHKQTLGMQRGTANSHIEFEVPKARLLSAINLYCKVTLQMENISGQLDVPGVNTDNQRIKLYDVLRRVSVNYNNGFAPFVGSGSDIATLNMLRNNAKAVMPSSEYNTLCPYGENNVYYFMLELPITLNERDTSGLVLAQNGQTLINFSADIAPDLFGNAVKDIEITPELVTFSVPDNASAFPDLSVLKIVESRKENITAGGSTLVKLPTGQIYRKLIFKLEDSNGNPIKPEDITSNIELLFNTADVPYSVHPQIMRLRTVSEIGCALPEGYYAWDFSYQGISNYGGARDYIDAEKITTCELRFTSAKSGKITIISERISRLTASK